MNPSAYDTTLAALTRYLDELREERTRNDFDYRKDGLTGPLHRRRKADEYRALRREIARVRAEQLRARLAAVA